MRKRKGIVEELSQRDGIGRSFPHQVMLSGFMPTASGLPLQIGEPGSSLFIRHIGDRHELAAVRERDQASRILM